ncbi:MAG TPA: XrtA system polysaccharide deacetylase [Burkholderiales bacterium]|nr:XrtA system polysaccharide deacetylase [Burkholderiales bacterium]
MPEIANALTVDVEDYFQVSALAPHIARADWERIPCRVERNVDAILSLFAEAGARATFFTLGWIAERHPGLVKKIVAEGHELASHGYGHLRIHEQTPAEFAQDIGRAKALLEDLSGTQVKGYRAPSFSVGPRTLWAFERIAQAGYRYSSSVYPVRHDLYGMPHAPRFAYRPRADLLEIPVTTAAVLHRNLPAGGGGYFRLLPYVVSRALIRRVNQVDRRSAVFYFHPWEIDPAQPRVPGTSVKARFRHYVNLRRTESRLRRLLRDFHWRRMDEVFLAPEASGARLHAHPATARFAS